MTDRNQMEKRPSGKTPASRLIDREIYLYRKHRNRVRFIRALFLVLIIALAIGIYISTAHFTLLRVEGNSMRKTLENGDTVLIRKTARVRQGDIIAFELEDELMIKRVIGLEGDRILIGADGTVLRNGEPIAEPYVYGLSLGNSDVVYPVTVEPGEIFCLGDHRSTSVDSRNSNFGNASTENILGTVEAVIWPFYRIGRTS